MISMFIEGLRQFGIRLEQRKLIGVLNTIPLNSLSFVVEETICTKCSDEVHQEIYVPVSEASTSHPPTKCLQSVDEVPSKCRRSAFKLSTMCLQSPPFGGTSRRVWRHLSQGLPVPCGAIGGYLPSTRRLFLECKGTTDYAKGNPLFKPQGLIEFPKFMFLV